MANKKYVLTRTVRHQGRAYRQGDERALIRDLSKDERELYIANGFLEQLPEVGASIDEPTEVEHDNSKVALHLLENQVRNIARTLPPLHSFNRVDGESDADYLFRYANAFAELAEMEDSDIDEVDVDDATNQRLEAVASAISGKLSFARHSDESPLETLERYANSLNAEPNRPVTPVQAEPDRETALLSVDDLTAVIDSPEAAQVLIDNGLNTRSIIRSFADKDLLKLPTVGKAAVGKLRAWLSA